MEFDTGCQRSILPEDFWCHSLGRPRLEPCLISFRTYTNETFTPIGQCKVKLEYQNQKVHHTFPVVKGNSLIGRDLMFSIKFNWNHVAQQCLLVKQNTTLSLKTLLRKYSEIFKPSTGLLRHFSAKIVVREDAVPKFLKARPIPFAIREKVDEELQSMENAGVITKVDHSEWASPLVVVAKPNGRVRITDDFKATVNPQLCITQYPLADIDELFSMMSGGQKFSKLDGVNVYHQLPVDKASKQFLVINTHRGLYRYNVLPQDIASSPAIFQEFMDKLLQGIPGAASYINDGICTGPNDQEHL